MPFIKRYWFGGLVSLVLLFFFLLFVIILISPKQDAKNRGFISCTGQMIDDLLDCQRGIWCSTKAIGKNTLCDIKIIAEGVKLWIDKKQPTPWSNYIFEPEIIENSFVDEEARAEFLKNNPNVQKEMLQLDKLRKELENEQIEAEFNEEILQKKQ